MTVTFQWPIHTSVTSCVLWLFVVLTTCDSTKCYSNVVSTVSAGDVTSSVTL
jgi:hypothetical protein